MFEASIGLPGLFCGCLYPPRYIDRLIVCLVFLNILFRCLDCLINCFDGMSKCVNSLIV